MSDLVAMQIRELKYSIQNKDIFDDISFSIRHGEIIALLGPNGAGKSTVMRSVAGLILDPFADLDGEILYYGKDFLKYSPKERAAKVVYLSSECEVDFPLTAYEMVSLSRNSKIEWAMSLTGSWHLKDREFWSLSSGEKQLVLLARAFCQGAKILFLDEVFSQIDLQNQSRMGKLLKRLSQQEGFSFLMVSHDLNLATEWADRCILMKEGRIRFQGPTSEVYTTACLNELYPSADLEVIPNPLGGTSKVFFRNK